MRSSGPTSRRLRGLSRQGARAVAASALLLSACSSAYPYDDECRTEPGCFEDAEVVCLDQPSSPSDESGCRTVELEPDSDDCADSTARVRVVCRAEGSGRISLEGEILEADPSAWIAGYFSPEESCLYACGAGMTTDETSPGWAFRMDVSTSREVASRELVFVGRGVRYRLTFCCVPTEP